MRMKRKKNEWLKKISSTIRRLFTGDKRDDLQRMLDESW